MDTATRINQLLRQLDVAAAELTDTQHPDVVVQLAANGASEGAEGIVECTVSETHAAGAGYSVTLTPTRAHCLDCGAIFDLPDGVPAAYCPRCAAAHALAGQR